jgi:hypothetical protein
MNDSALDSEYSALDSESLAALESIVCNVM